MELSQREKDLIIFALGQFGAGIEALFPKAKEVIEKSEVGYSILYVGTLRNILACSQKDWEEITPRAQDMVRSVEVEVYRQFPELKPKEQNEQHK
jgi:hypothetical protein